MQQAWFPIERGSVDTEEDLHRGQAMWTQREKTAPTSQGGRPRQSPLPCLGRSQLAGIVAGPRAPDSRSAFRRPSRPAWGAMAAPTTSHLTSHPTLSNIPEHSFPQDDV